MNRVLPEQVVEAYKVTGLIPNRLGWFDGVSARKALNAEFGSDPIPVEKGAVKGDA